MTLFTKNITSALVAILFTTSSLAAVIHIPAAQTAQSSTAAPKTA